jgi:hypothetical protein
MTLAASAALGAVFGVLAGACAFFITYAELKRNWSFFGSPARRAFRTALVTFVFFFLATLLLPQIFQAAGD